MHFRTCKRCNKTFNTWGRFARVCEDCYKPKSKQTKQEVKVYNKKHYTDRELDEYMLDGAKI